MDEPPEDAENSTLVEVGRYRRLSLARERGLVMAAMDVPHWVVREGQDFVLKVEPRWRERASLELEKYESEIAARPPAMAEAAGRKVSSVSMYVAAWVFAAFWTLQNVMGEAWLKAGAAESKAIVRQGQWWRAFTALTLHGDLGHFAANLAAGLLFAFFLLPRWGGGVTWLAIVLTGALGNTLNAFFYQSEPHLSIGASTAVLGALGLQVGAEFCGRLSSEHTRSRWQLVLPLGAGLGLLAFLGAGTKEDHTDFMAHLWGFLAGGALGGPLSFFFKTPPKPWVQWLAAATVAFLLTAAWLRAAL